MARKVLNRKSYGSRADLNREFVYIATDGLRLKIGRTWHLRLRMVQLTRSAEKPVRLLAYIPHSELSPAAKQEMEFHRSVSAKWRGDWHPMDPQLLISFVRAEGAVVCL